MIDIKKKRELKEQMLTISNKLQIILIRLETFDDRLRSLEHSNPEMSIRVSCLYFTLEIEN
mgnify:CR=1 FL=1